MQFIGNRFENFISGNGIWIIIGCLCAAFVVSIVFLFLNINRAKKILKSQKEVQENEKTTQNKVVKEGKKEISATATKTTKQDKPSKQNKPSKQTITTSEKPAKASSDKKEANEKRAYTITEDEKTKEWVVKRVGATRATRRCATKKEAEELVLKLTK